tara:strand:- start:80 stop:763 length:684 start_codon:yes stop_codon:yes gene_type:complete
MAEQEMTIDFQRTERLGFGEAVFCSDKSSSQINEILVAVQNDGSPILMTRLSEAKFDALDAAHRYAMDYDPISETGFFRFAQTSGQSGRVAVVTAGTSDARIAREASRTLEFNGEEATLFFDVGVAGLWRLTSRLGEIKSHPIVIAVAGMDAALVSVLGGLIPGIMIGVPTSTGYGAARNGETALGASLSSCAPGVTICNIDNGYGAACAALRALHSATLLAPSSAG